MRYKAEIIILISLMFSITLNAKEIRIGVIDEFESIPNVKLCKPMTKLVEYGRDHGNEIVSLIESKSRVNRCYILIHAMSNGKDKTTEALKLMNEEQIDILNLSLSGWGEDEEEKTQINKIKSKKTLIVVSSGNEGFNLDSFCRIFPACYGNQLIVVGSTNTKGNHGKVVDLYYDGRYKVKDGYKVGTSYSTARITGIITNKVDKFKELIYGKD